MKRRTIFNLLLLLPMLMSLCFAQSKIEGKISDSKDQQKLSNATIMLLSAKDSILLDFTRSDEHGNFSLNTPIQSESVLIVSYPKYGDYYTSILPNQEYSALKVGLTSTAQLLQEVIVTGRIPITIKGDTTEYDAGSFKVEKNAKVEDLLKVLPGITVDASGKITAQGKTVKKVLVDGEEFFTNCLIRLEPCKPHDDSKPLCPVHAQYDHLRNEIAHFYQDTNLEIVSLAIKKYEDLVKL